LLASGFGLRKVFFSGLAQYRLSAYLRILAKQVHVRFSPNINKNM
jgi:hypothetical protein